MNRFSSGTVGPATGIALRTLMDFQDLLRQEHGLPESIHEQIRARVSLPTLANFDNSVRVTHDPFFLCVSGESEFQYHGQWTLPVSRSGIPG